MRNPYRLIIFALLLIFAIHILKGDLYTLNSNWRLSSLLKLKNSAYLEIDDMQIEALSAIESEVTSRTRCPQAAPSTVSQHIARSERVIVMARTSKENTDWLKEELSEYVYSVMQSDQKCMQRGLVLFRALMTVDVSSWSHAVYVVDDVNAEFRVRQNKGRESSVYLQFILDHFDHLPQLMVFLHAHRSSWHVDDNAANVRRLQLDYVREQGYANLRCEWGPGCPDEIYPFRQLAGRTTEIAYAGAWIQLFENQSVPEIVASPCCAQFAVTREKVLDRPLSDYQHYYQWLMDTELDDDTSGRVFEYLWHIIFGQEPVS